MSQSMSQSRRAIALAFTVVLASQVGCSAIPLQEPCRCPTSTPMPTPAVPSTPEHVVTGQMDDMMQYYESLRKLAAPDLAKLHERVKQNFAQNKSDANRMRLVLLLTLPHTSFRDIHGAVNLLNEWPREVKPNSLQSFRNLLATFLTEQQRLSNTADEASQKLKEEQKKADLLQHQIDALKSMEKNLILNQP